jgi:hypothetical protein
MGVLNSMEVEMTEIELSKITEADLQRLITSSASESNSIEYKERLTLNTDPEKKEILKDLSAFANSSGGDILFGVKAEKGIPKQLVGIEIDNKDSMTLRIEDILRYGMQPRIPNVKIHFVPLQNNRSVLIIRVPKSWLSPHRVVFNKNNEFYLRLSAGSYPMDVDQLRTAFLASETLNKKIENFRLERVSKIIGNETPVLMIDGPKIILHLIPIISFNNSKNIKMNYVASNPANRLRPIYNSPWKWRYNLDGYIVYSLAEKEARSYVQLYKTGIIEAVCASLIRARSKDAEIDPKIFEKEIMESFGTYLRLMKELEVDPPIIAYLTLLGVKGYCMGIGQSFFYDEEDIHRIDRDILFLPEVLIENYGESSDVVLRPIFDSVWNACGEERSLSYDEKSGRRNP